jgi:hypothetical protein
MTSIPKIIIQTWKTKNVPTDYGMFTNSVKKHHPDYTYLFFDDNDIDMFIRTTYPQYYSTFQRLPIKIQQIDFFRYIAVYHYGGFYLDIDIEVYKNFDPLLNNDCIFPIDEYIDENNCGGTRFKALYDKGWHFLVGQYAFAARPHHPFLKKVIDRIRDLLPKYLELYTNCKNYTFKEKNSIGEPGKLEQYIFSTTGPDFITREYVKYNQREDITLLHPKQCLGEYATHFSQGNWARIFSRETGIQAPIDIKKINPLNSIIF